MRGMIFAVFCLSVAQGEAIAEPGPGALDIPELTANADVIVTGEPAKPGPNLDDGQRYELSVIKILKGPVPVGNLQINGTPLRGIDLGINQPRIYFLRAEANGSLSILNAALAATGDAPGARALSPEPLEAVTNELVSVLASPPDSFLARNPALAARFGTSILEIDQENSQIFGSEDGTRPRDRDIPATPSAITAGIYLNEMQALQSLPDEQAVPILKSALHARLEPVNVLWLISGLIVRGDLSELQNAVPLLLAPDASSSSGVGAFKSAIESGYRKARTPNAVPALTQLLSSKDVVVRRGAASALRDSPADSGLKPLATIALNDPDIDVRYFAETGLCNISRNIKRQNQPSCNFPTRDRADEARARIYWTTWTADNIKD